MTDDAAVMSLELPDRPQAAAAARKALTVLNGNLHLISAARLQDVQLLVSELVANAYRHAQPRGESLHLAVLATDDVLRVEVRDAGRGFDPAAVADVPLTTGRGKGLRIVAALTDRWGVETGDGTTVWFEVDRPRRREPIEPDADAQS
jgi:anti-sigma regulatory factor (Ser/Thr protein kinase)